MMSKDTPIVDEVRKRRHEISQRYQHDVKAYAEHLRELQKRHAERVVSQITVVPVRRTNG